MTVGPLTSKRSISWSPQHNFRATSAAGVKSQPEEASAEHPRIQVVLPLLALAWTTADGEKEESQMPLPACSLVLCLAGKQADGSNDGEEEQEHQLGIVAVRK